MAKQTQELDVERDGIGEEVEQDVRQSQDPIAATAPTRQPEKKTDDLTADERFRKWQAEYDKKLANLQKESQLKEQRYQQQLAEREKALREQQLAGMDDYERAKYEREEAKREAEYWRQQASVIQTQTARERALAQIANKAKVPMEVLEEAESEGHAWQLAWDYREQQEQEQTRQRDEQSAEKQAQREQKKAANRVDTGAGVPAAAADDWGRATDSYRKNKDAAGLFRYALNPKE